MMRRLLLFYSIMAYYLLSCTDTARPPDENNLKTYDEQISAYEMDETGNPPPENPILFIGSSSIRLWDSLQEMFPGKPVLNRGFGGSELPDLVYFFDRVVLPYDPGQVVIYCGDNDVARGHNAREVYRDFRKLFRLIRIHFPDARITFISIKPSPARWEWMPEMRRANSMIAAYLSRKENTSFLDVEPLMVDEFTGCPRAEIFTPDSLHLNRKGYEIWAEALRPLLMH